MAEKEFDQSLSSCHCANLRQASRAVTQYYEDLLKPSGLKITQYSLLRKLRRLGPMTMNELAEVLRLERTTLVRNLKPLEDKGLVSVYGQKTAKAYLVGLTEEGEKSLEAALPDWSRAQQGVNELLTNEDLETFQVVLQKLASITNHRGSL